MQTALVDAEPAAPVDIRAQALLNDAFCRTVVTGANQQVVVMTLPPDGDTGEQVHPDSDQLFILVEGSGEARVGPLVYGVEPGDLVFVAAGTRHTIVNRAVTPLRLISVFAPPVFLPGTVHATKEEATAAAF